MALIACSVPELVPVLRQVGHDVLIGQDPSIHADQADLAVTAYDGGEIAPREWVRHLRRSLGELPLLVLVDDIEQADDALIHGASDVLRQPVSSTMLDARVRSALSHALEADPSSVPGGARDLLERLIDASPDPVIAADLSGTLLLFSRAAEAILELSADDVLHGKLHVGELYADPGDATRIMQAMRQSPDRTASGIRVRLRTRRGEPIPVDLSASLVHDFSGRPVASVGIFRDEREVHTLSERLASATDQLVASEKRAATAAVAAATAHELNQPLTSVMGLVELIRMDEELPERVHDRMERATAQLERMAEIVRTMRQGVSP